MNWERICLFASHVGTMDRLLEQSITFDRKHKRFGQAIGTFQAISHRIADMKVQLEAARLLTYQSALRLGRVRDSSNIRRSMARSGWNAGASHVRRKQRMSARVSFTK